MRRILGVLLLFMTGLAPASESDSFRLTMPNIHATMASLKGLVQLLEADPQLRARFKAEKSKLGDTNGRDTLSMTAERLQAMDGRVAAVYKKAGITPKQAGMTLETLLGVVMGDAMLQASKTKADLPKGFVADNMAFFQQHKPEIMQAFGELKNLGASLKEEDNDSEDEDEEQAKNEDAK